MFSNEQANYLIELPKKALENDKFLDSMMIQQEFPFQKSIQLGSEQDHEFVFLFEINQSKKNSLKLTLHYQEDESKIGLVRIDYNRKHKNPEIINEFLPEIFHPFAGKWFEYHEHHIHYFVEGYRPLDWAIPLFNDSFPIKEITSNQNLLDSINSFCKKINLKTELIFNEIML